MLTDAVYRVQDMGGVFHKQRPARPRPLPRLCGVGRFSEIMDQHENIEGGQVIAVPIIGLKRNRIYGVEEQICSVSA